MLTMLSHELTLRLGKGYSRPNLNNMRKFYLCYPICQTVSDKLSWSHICELIKIDDELERSFYEKETVKEKWDVRTLRRQMESALFLLLAVSRDKEGILALAQNGIEIQRPEDVIKSTYTLEFLNLPELDQYTEGDLEKRIIDNLQKFLLELGKGFTFVGRQYPLIILSKNKDELLVEYATYGMDSHLFVSKYELYLPNRKELERLVNSILKEQSGKNEV